MTDEEWTKTTFRLPKKLLKEVKQYGLDNEKTDTDVFIEALKDFLEKKKGKKKQGE